MRTIITQKITEFLKQGLTPVELAWTISLGVTIGVFPVLGMTTILCALAAVTFRLNLPAIQSINWAMSPLQLLLLIPFTHAGAWIFGGSGISVNLAELKLLMESDLLGTMERYLLAVLRGIAAWTLIALPTAILLHWVTLPLISRVARTFSTLRTEEGLS